MFTFYKIIKCSFLVLSITIIFIVTSQLLRCFPVMWKTKKLIIVICYVESDKSNKI